MAMSVAKLLTSRIIKTTRIIKIEMIKPCPHLIFPAMKGVSLTFCSSQAVSETLTINPFITGTTKEENNRTKHDFSIDTVKYWAE